MAICTFIVCRNIFRILDQMKILHMIREIWPYFWSKQEGTRSLIVFSILAAGCASILTVVSPLILRTIVDSFAYLPKQEFGNIVLLTLAYGMSWTLGQVMVHIRAILVRKSSQMSLKGLILKLLKHLNRLPISYHYNRKTGDIISLIQRVEHSFPSFIQGVFWQIFPLLFEIALAIIFIIKICGWSFGLGLFMILSAYLASLVLSVEKAALLQKKNTIKHSEVSSYIVDSMLNFETIRMFNTIALEEKKLEKILNEEAQTEYQTILKMETFGIYQALILGIGLSILTTMSAFKIHNGLLTVGDFILIVTYLLQFSLPISFFGYVAREIRISLTNIEDFIQLLKTPIEVDTPRLYYYPSTDGCDVFFRNVGFSYHKDRTILQDISFSLSRGRKLGIVGYSGEGKSTITKLLLKFFKTGKGEILINGDNINELSVEALRHNIGIVPQDIVLFNDTLHYNLVYGTKDVSLNTLEEAIRLVRLDKLIRALPDGFNTIVGERGVKLSGGEKQRIALVRALLKKPNLYIFDEATSSLDFETEKSILADIMKISKGVTSIMISHRLSAVVNVDEIIMIADGKIIERGNHTSLLSLNGAYAALWKQQL